jgi:hypothetical protein
MYFNLLVEVRIAPPQSTPAEAIVRRDQTFFDEGVVEHHTARLITMALSMINRYSRVIWLNERHDCLYLGQSTCDWMNF